MWYGRPWLWKRVKIKNKTFKNPFKKRESNKKEKNNTSSYDDADRQLGKEQRYSKTSFFFPFFSEMLKTPDKGEKTLTFLYLFLANYLITTLQHNYDLWKVCHNLLSHHRE